MAKIKSFAELKRRLRPGVTITMVRRDYPPLKGIGIDATGIPRKVVVAQSNAVAFESVRGDGKPSWLYWPKASEVELLDDGFKVKGLTYRIEE
jgi:hypothetical protein